MACFRDFENQVYMGLVGDGTGEVGRGHPTRHLGSHIKELKHYSEGYGRQ